MIVLFCLSNFGMLRNDLFTYGFFIKHNRNIVHNKNNENLVLQSVIHNPRNSLCQMENNVRVPKSTARRFLEI